MSVIDMSLRELLKRDDVIDVVQNKEAIYVLTRAHAELPPIYSDRRVEIVASESLHIHPERLAILAGESLKHGTKGLQERIIYTYDLANSTARQKQTLAHKLYGTGGRKSLLDAVGGTRLGRGSFMIPADVQETIEELLDEQQARYEKRRILLEEAT